MLATSGWLPVFMFIINNFVFPTSTECWEKTLVTALQWPEFSARLRRYFTCFLISDGDDKSTAGTAFVQQMIWYHCAVFICNISLYSLC